MRARHSGTLRERVRRLPLRARLVAGFSATMFVVLTAAGAFVYWRVAYALDRQVNGELTEVTRVVAPLVTPSGRLEPGADRVVGGELFQVLDHEGRVIRSSPGLGPDPLVSPETGRAAQQAPVRRDIGALLTLRKVRLRVYATALPDAEGQRAAVLVAAVSRDHRDEALLELLGQLAAAGLGALVVTALVGERLAKFALRPVERYRAQAEDIAAGASGVRLEVPTERDDEVTRLGNTLNHMLEALEDALEAERRFVDDASHELRTPLTLLKTRVQLARSRSRSVEEHEAVLAEIETDVVRLTRLADHLLRLGAQPEEESRSDLVAVAQHEVTRRDAVGRATGSRAAASGAAGVRLQAAGAPVEVALGAMQVAQVLSNLLDNADRHGAPPVTVAVDALDGWGRLRVTDQGEGMDPELLATATRRFARAAESRSREGFGLGLSLVESIVVGAGGEVRLCHGGHHERIGREAEVPCDHGPAMTITVLLPSAR